MSLLACDVSQGCSVDKKQAPDGINLKNKFENEIKYFGKIDLNENRTAIKGKSQTFKENKMELEYKMAQHPTTQKRLSFTITK